MAKAGRHMQMTIRVLSALALLCLSFAHQPVFARQVASQMAAQYVLPDGSIGDICFGTDGVEGHNSSHEGLAPVCDYCRLAASVLLPSPSNESYLLDRSAALVSDRPDFQPIFVAYPRILPQSRAPPVLL